MNPFFTYCSAAILGIVQGVTEFLPVSSSGHLVIFQNIPLIREAIAQLDMMTLDVMLHLATLVSVIIVFRKDVARLIVEFFGLVGDLFHRRPCLTTPYRRMIVMLLIAVIPAGLLGVTLKSRIESWFSSLTVVGFALLVTAAITCLCDKLASGKKTAANASFASALGVGLLQAVAMIPGVSRSGSTIFGGLLQGYERKFAVKFSFLLSIPTILGAVLVQTLDLVQEGGAAGAVLPYVVGGLFAAVAGIFAIKFLVKLLSQQKFYLFSIYCALVGVAVIVYGFFAR